MNVESQELVLTEASQGETGAEGTQKTSQELFNDIWGNTDGAPDDITAGLTPTPGSDEDLRRKELAAQKVTDEPKDIASKIKIGEDGLIVRKEQRSGLLLPQVPIEWNWDVYEFLEETCLKAGLPQDTWLEPDTKIYKFQGQIFSEEKPKGKVVEKKIK